MISNAVLLPLPVVAPMIAAAALLMTHRMLPKRGPDIVAAGSAGLSGVACAMLAVRSAQGPLISWFGGWVPRDGLTLGIAFAADQASASIACLVCLLFSASFVFAWGYFEKIGAHFQILMLLFLAAMVGFCLTHDLFNMFVWFEIMSVAAFALTGSRLESSAIEGALNFTVTNSLAGFLMLAGIGLVYARTGALDMAAIAHRLAGGTAGDVVVLTAICLIACALLIKAAAVPFHFWLSDAHAVAPSPVCVIFSGAMVSLGLFGIAKLSLSAFGPAADATGTLHMLMVLLGAFGACVGGLMSLAQRHVKRMLAFSTIAHSGIMLAGVGILSGNGVAGLMIYMVGHGLIKGALFMVAGILLATRASIDEIGLRGLGDGEVRLAGVVMALGGLLLAGLPVGLIDRGFTLIHAGLVEGGEGWVIVPMTFGAALTGGAVLRATGRIFLGLGPNAGSEADAPTEAEQEQADRPFWLMATPCFLLCLLAFCPGAWADAFARHAIGAFIHPPVEALIGLGGPSVPKIVPLAAQGDAMPGWIGTAGALVIAAYALTRDRAPAGARLVIQRLTRPAFDALQYLHSGLIADYVVWISLGLAALAASLMMGALSAGH